jgi:acid stress-induced BolA-like protein IbaG/YrbA
MSGDVVGSIVSAVEGALSGARCEVELGSPGHYALTVVWAGFSGRSRLEQQRAVLSAIAPLMKGEAAPLHAVDRLTTRVA